MILDIFSRYVVGWIVAQRESAAIARVLIEESVRKQGVPPSQLTLHADRGGAMSAKSTAMLLADLGVIKSHSRPHVSDDNPFSEAQFKTLKYRPEFPERFGSVQDARAFCRVFFPWYDTEHHHSALGLLTPHDVHYGAHVQVRERRQTVLDAAFAAHPERFVRRPPTPPPVPAAVWINPPTLATARRQGLPSEPLPREALFVAETPASHDGTWPSEGSGTGFQRSQGLLASAALSQ